MEHTINYYIKSIPGFCALAALMFSATAQAQIEEVVVTAQKRAEDVQDVPISISTFSGEFIEDSGADDLQALANYTPNLTLTKSSQVANNRIILRGVGSVGNSAIEPSVAVFIDGVYYPRPSSVVGSLSDLEIVEVLRGPQGTLFGRNASTGALNIRTKKPSDELEGRIKARYGDFDSKYVAGSLSGAFSPTAAGRLSFQYSDRDGYGDNTFTNNGSREEVGDYEDVSIRGKLYFSPTDNLEVNVAVDYARVENEGGVIEVISDTVVPDSALGPGYETILGLALDPNSVPGVIPPGAFATTLGLGPTPDTTDTFDYDLNQDHRDDATDDQFGIAVDWTWTVGEHDIRSITGVRRWENDTFESALRLPGDLLNRVTNYQVDTFSQEFQIISPTGGFLEYVAGVYYYEEEYSIDQNFNLGSDFCQVASNAGFLQGFNGTLLAGGSQALALATGLGAAGGLSGVCNAFSIPGLDAVDADFEQDVTSYAVFGQATFNLTEQLRITGGLRLTRDEKNGDFTQIVNNPSVAPVAIPGVLPGLDLRINETSTGLEFSDTELTWMANVSYYFNDDILLFATASTGFKSGGFNSDGFNSDGIARGASRIFNSETVDNYELGVKSSWFDNRLIANMTLFRTEISDFQDRQFDGVNFFVLNAGELTQQGVELDLIANPIDPLYMVLGVSYLDSDFDSFDEATALPAQIFADPTATVDLAGERNHFSPKWQLSLVTEWADALPTTNLGWFVRGEFQHISSQNVGAETNQNPQSIQSGYELVNAKVGLRGEGDHQWELSFFIKNAFDEEYCQTIFNQPVGITLGLVDPTTGGGLQRCVLGVPQTLGVEAGYSF